MHACMLALHYRVPSTNIYFCLRSKERSLFLRTKNSTACTPYFSTVVYVFQLRHKERPLWFGRTSPTACMCVCSLLMYVLCLRHKGRSLLVRTEEERYIQVYALL